MKRLKQLGHEICHGARSTLRNVKCMARSFVLSFLTAPLLDRVGREHASTRTSPEVHLRFSGEPCAEFEISRIAHAWFRADGIKFNQHTSIRCQCPPCCKKVLAES